MPTTTQLEHTDKIDDPAAYAADIEDIGLRITAVFRRHVWICGDDITELLRAKDCMLRIKRRMAART
jgi:hypothetical protein